MQSSLRWVQIQRRFSPAPGPFWTPISTYGLKKAAKAGVVVPHWHPHQLRHNRGTEVRQRYGIEAAQVALGHARADVTQVYAEKNLEHAKRIAREMG